MTSSTSPTQLGILATKIAREAYEPACALVAAGCKDETLNVGQPFLLNASLGGRWQIHSTSKLLTIDAHVPLTDATTASIDTLAAELVRSFWTTAIGKIEV